MRAVRIDGKSGKIIGFIDGRVRIKLDDWHVVTIGRGLLHATDAFFKMSADEMSAYLKQPNQGRKIGERVKISTEEPLYG